MPLVTLSREVSGSPQQTLSSKAQFPMTTRNQRQILSPIHASKKGLKAKVPQLSQSVALKSPIDSRKQLLNHGI